MSKLPEGWVETTLGDVAKTNRLSINKDFKYKEILYLDTGSITKGQIEALQRIKIVDAPSRAKRLVNDEDIIYSTVRPNQEHYGYIEKPAGNLVVSTGFTVVENNKEVSNSKFLYLFLTQKTVINALQQIAEHSTSAYPSIKLSDIEELPLFLPPLPEQKAIAGVLSAFDDKIELLREQNRTLETLAQTIFKEWFVNFNFPDIDGLSACGHAQAGKPYKDSGGEMVDLPTHGVQAGSELGKIPKGWRVGKLGEIVDIFDFKRIPLSSKERQKRQGVFPYYGATKIMDHVDDYLFDGTYLLFAEDGSVIDDNGYPFLQYVWGKFWVNNHTHILQGKNGFSTEAVYVFFRKRKIASIVNGAVQLKINQTNLLNFELVLPDCKIIEEFNGLLSPIFNKIKNNAAQIQTLSKTRDTLLPKLMSGEIRVKGFEQ